MPATGCSQHGAELLVGALHAQVQLAQSGVAEHRSQQAATDGSCVGVLGRLAPPPMSLWLNTVHAWLNTVGLTLSLFLYGGLNVKA